MLASLDLSKRKDAASLREVFKLAKELDLVVHKTERHELNLLSDDGLHQVGYAGGGGMRPWSSVRTWAQGGQCNRLGAQQCTKVKRLAQAAGCTSTTSQKPDGVAYRPETQAESVATQNVSPPSPLCCLCTPPCFAHVGLGAGLLALGASHSRDLSYCLRAGSCKPRGAPTRVAGAG